MCVCVCDVVNALVVVSATSCIWSQYLESCVVNCMAAARKSMYIFFWITHALLWLSCDSPNCRTLPELSCFRGLSAFVEQLPSVYCRLRTVLLYCRKVHAYVMELLRHVVWLSRWRVLGVSVSQPHKRRITAPYINKIILYRIVNILNEFLSWVLFCILTWIQILHTRLRLHKMLVT